MYETFYIPKEANTYADTLEAYGVAHLIQAIYDNQNIEGDIKIYDKGNCFQVTLEEPLSKEILSNLNYFQVIQFIKKDKKVSLPNNFREKYFDFLKQKEIKANRKADFDNIKDLKGGERKQAIIKIEEKYHSEGESKLRDEYDVLSQLADNNNIKAFSKVFENLYLNKNKFSLIITEILKNYSISKQENGVLKELIKQKKISITNNITNLQLINPNKGKGLNKAKALGIETKNRSSDWTKELMKLNGAMKFGMSCILFPSGSRSFDMKIYVPVFNEMILEEKTSLLKKFKRIASSNTPIKLDILNTLKICELFLKQHERRRRRKLKEFLSGFHVVYQKQLSQHTKSVTNIGFLQTPDFINVADKKDWLEIIDDQKRLLNGITEQGDAMIGLLAYRNFLNGSNINEYFKFNYWYATYLMHELSNKKQTYVTTNKITTLNKIFTLMDISFKEIIENEGFQSVAAAIRKSTVSLQYTPKDQRKFDVQYGLAQKLQNKSKSKDDLVTFVGEFIGKYNSDTARQHEKTGQSFRANVKDKELLAFFELADKVSSKVLGAMLAAYGFALNKKEKIETTAA